MKQEIQNTFTEFLKYGFYQSYIYSYPHKTAYRIISPKRKLVDAWNGEKQDALFLYIHIPFCFTRCGFCNLFSVSKPDKELQNSYIHTLQRQAEILCKVIPNKKFANFAIGGGTPSLLDINMLNDIFNIAENKLNVDIHRVPVSVEINTKINKEKLELLKQRGTSRISVGVQTFIEKESKVLSRFQEKERIVKTLTNIKKTKFETFNIDLIYGIPGQTIKSWLFSVNQALFFEPEEIFLYPLYVRSLTKLGMDKTTYNEESIMMSCYHRARDLLIKKGYNQLSMRRFKYGEFADNDTLEYSCQEDGMVGLGCGARSYTSSLHYSSGYAVSRQNVYEIIKNYIQKPDDSFLFADYGFFLNKEEQKRRYVLKSILYYKGLNLIDYKNYFNSDALSDFPQIYELEILNLAINCNNIICLTDKGFSYSDVIGPWLISNNVKTLMEGFILK